MDLGSFFSDLGNFVGSLIKGANGQSGAAGATGSTSTVGPTVARAAPADNSSMMLLGLAAIVLLAGRK